MAITVRAASTLQNSTSALSDTYVLPTGHTLDDLLLIVHGSRITGSIASSNYSADSGAYTEAAYVEDTATVQTEPHGIVFRKFHDGSESDPTVATTATPNMMLGTMTALTGVDQTTPEDATAVDSVNSGAATEFTPTGITTVTDGAMVLSIVWGIGLTNFALKAGSEQGFTLLAGGADFDSASGQDMGIGIAYKEQASFGAVTAPTWTCNSSEWLGTTMALRPASSGVSGGSTSTVTVASEGAGNKAISKGSDSTVTTVASGAGPKAVPGGADSTITVVASGGGFENFSAGSDSTVTVVSEGGGSTDRPSGSTSTVTTVASGDGPKAVSSGSDSTITVVASGGGTSSEDGSDFQGGSTSTVSVVASGDGFENFSAGNEAIIVIEATGGGTADDPGAASEPLTPGNAQKRAQVAADQELDLVGALRVLGATSGEAVGALNQVAGNPSAQWRDFIEALQDCGAIF